MGSFLESVYFNSPVLLQNVYLSLYGYRINKIRHGRDYGKILTTIENRLHFSPGEMEKFQYESLREMVQLCAANVPYYRNMFKKIGLAADSIRSLEDLRRIPLLEKNEIRRNPQQFINDHFKKHKFIKIHTTGTTGMPLNVYCNTQVRQENYAFYTRFLKTSGINYKKKRATFGGRIIFSNDQKKPPFWRYNFPQKNLLLSSYHLRDDTIKSYIDKIIRFSPHYIDAYPSSIYTLAKFAKEHQINLKGVTDGITTSAETLFADQRLLIEDVFGVPIIDQYGAVEMCVFVGQCNRKSYHVHSDYGIIEFIRKDGSAAAPGEEAELVCTGFINPVMPLLRYRIGDYGILSDRTCDCNSPFPVIEKILGRIDDVIITPEGNRIGRLSPVLKGFPVKEAQYLQDNINVVVVRLVPADGYCHKTENELEVELRKRLGQTIEIRIEKVRCINRGTGGKLKSIVSTLKKVDF